LQTLSLTASLRSHWKRDWDEGGKGYGSREILPDFKKTYALSTSGKRNICLHRKGQKQWGGPNDGSGGCLLLCKGRTVGLRKRKNFLKKKRNHQLGPFGKLRRKEGSPGSRKKGISIVHSFFSSSQGWGRREERVSEEGGPQIV